MDPSPRIVSSAEQVVVRPFELGRLGRVVAAAAGTMQDACRRLRAARWSTRLHPSDPDLPAELLFAVRPAFALSVEADRLDLVATEVLAARDAAIEADGGRWISSVDRLAGWLSVGAVRSAVAHAESLSEGWAAIVDLAVGIGGPHEPRPSPLLLSPRSPTARRSSPLTGGAGRRLGHRTIGWIGPGRADPAHGPGRADPAHGPGRADPVHGPDGGQAAGMAWAGPGRSLGGGDPEARGRRAVDTALGLTADGQRIGPHEIGLIDHGDRCYTIVLPGVTDLSHPSMGWNPRHRSVRDLDMAAVQSARSSSVADNAYARVVAEALERADVPSGSRLTIVGHSYGADTALDLAADPAFNGTRYDVDHVVAAGYYSQPQLPHVPPSTDVLVLQNRRDLVVEAERLGRWAMAPVESVAAAMVGSTGSGARTGSGLTVVTFNGGYEGAGHHPDNYRRFLDDSSPSPGSDRGPGVAGSNRVGSFLARIGSSPSGRGGLLRAVNVSVDR